MFWLIAESVMAPRKPVEDMTSVKYSGRELYSSMFCFGRDMDEYLKQHGTPKDFDGDTFGHHFIIDFDKPANQEFVTMTRAILPLLNRLHHIGVEYRLFRSGQKGFHLYIPKDYVKYPAELDSRWNMANKFFARKLIAEFPEATLYVDEGIYDKQRLFRFPYSKHMGSGKSKMLLNYRPIENLSGLEDEEVIRAFDIGDMPKDQVIKDIFEGMPRDNAEYFIDITDVVDLKEPSPKSPYNHDYKVDSTLFTTAYGDKPCITNIRNSTDIEGSRHRIALVLMAHWREKGESESSTLALLRDWNSRLKKPLPDSEIEKDIMKYFGQGYIYNCDNEIKRKFCDPVCPYHRAHNRYGQDIHTPIEVLEELRVIMAMPKKNDIDYRLLYPEFTMSPIKPDLSHVTTVTAVSRVGKTTFILNTMLHFTNINWLFLSYDMSRTTIIANMWNIVHGWRLEKGTRVATKAEEEDFNLCTNHITVIDRAIPINDLGKTFEYIQASTGKQYKAVVLDYIQMIPPSRINSSDTEKATEIAMAVRQFAKDYKVAPFLLSQVPMEKAGEGEIELPLYAAKNSSEIINQADFAINCWRPNITGINGPDNKFVVCAKKDRYGPTPLYASLYFNGPEMRIVTNQPRIIERAA